MLTFHLPFIIAATALGGPGCGRLGGDDLDDRGPRAARQRGALVRHAGQSRRRWPSPPSSPGVVFDLVRNGSLGERDRPAPGCLADRHRRRDPRPVGRLDGRWRPACSSCATGSASAKPAGCSTPRSGRRLPSEVVLGWILTLAYSTIGWWAAVICSTLVLVVWQAHDFREVNRHDAMTGLLSRSGFDARLEEILVGVRRGAGRARPPGDRPRRVQGDQRHVRPCGRRRRDPARSDARLRASIRSDRCRRSSRRRRVRGDACRRLRCRPLPVALAGKILDEIREPVDTDRGRSSVGASIGIVIDRARRAGSRRSNGCTPWRTRRCTRQARAVARVRDPRAQRPTIDPASRSTRVGWTCADRTRSRPGREPRTSVDEGAGPPIVLLHAGIADLCGRGTRWRR